MNERKFSSPELIHTVPVIPDLPQLRQETTEVKLNTLSKQDQILADLPDAIAEELFAKMAGRGISA